MSRYLNEYIEQIKRNTGDPANVSEEIYISCVNQAVRIFSRYRPRIIVTDVTGSSSAGDFLIDLPSTFVDSFSSVLSVEYPYSSTKQVPTYLKPGRYQIYRTPTDIKLRLLDVKLTNSQTARITITAPHLVTMTSTTIQDIYEDAVASQATSILAEIVSAEFANVARSTLGDLAIDFRLKSQEWQIIADRYQLLFRKDLGLGDNDTTPIVGWTDIDSRFQWGNDFITHPAEWQ
jgi:hypothetical protein